MFKTVRGRVSGFAIAGPNSEAERESFRVGLGRVKELSFYSLLR
jgi:hypothetical protein